MFRKILALWVAILFAPSALAAFPQTVTESTSASNSDSTSQVVTLPASRVNGNLIVCALSTDGAVTHTWPGTWNERLDVSRTGVSATVGSRIIDGSEGSTVTVTSSASEKSTHHCWQLSGHDAAIMPEALSANNNGATANPPNLTPTGGAKDYLWLALAAMQPGNNVATDFPDNYTDTGQEDGDANTTQSPLAWGRRELNAASEDPNTFTMTSSNWIAVTVAIHPGAAATPDFDSGPTLNNCDATGCVFDYDANADADHIWGMCLSTAESTPSAAAIKAGTGSNGDANEVSTGSADTLAITFTDSPVFPIYNCHFVAEEGTGNFSSVVSVLSVLPDAPTGKAFWPILSIGTDSPCERFNTATAPDIVANDWLLSDDATDPGAYALTVLNTCQFSYTGDSSRQTVLDIGVYDASAGGWHADDIDFVANNFGPACLPDNPLALLYKDEAMVSLDLQAFGDCSDPEGDTLEFSITSGSLPTGTSLSGTGNKDWGGTPTVEDEAGESLTIQVADPYGEITSYDAIVYVTDDVIVTPDCVTGGVTVEECLVLLDALRPWLESGDQLSASFSFSDTVAEDDIISQDPLASATISSTGLLGVSVSLGAALVLDSGNPLQRMRFRKTPEGLRTH